MKRIILGALATLGLLSSFAAGRACAQVGPGPYAPPTMYNPYQRPIFSPYMNMALPGNAALNYYGLVRPQLEMGAALQNIEGQMLMGNGYGANGYLPQQMLVTGHPIGFLTHRAYFMNIGAPGQTSAVVGGYGGGYGGVAAPATSFRPNPMGAAPVGIGR